MISKFFIHRPIFASVISIVIVLAGLVSIGGLPISQYPSIIPPEVSISATYPGANAQVVATTVAAPLETEINGVPNMIYMRSVNSNSGQLSMTVTFAIGTNPDQATIDVNNRVQAALVRLPAEVRAQGVRVAKRSSSILEVIGLYSEDGRYDPIYLSNYALINIIDDIKRLPGVGDANIFGARDYSIRIWLRPDKLAQYKLTPADVATAVQEQNSQFAAGSFGDEPMKDVLAFTYPATTQGRFTDPKQFEEIILRAGGSSATLRLKDVARVELGAQNYSLDARMNGKPAIAFAIYLQPGANALSTTAAVQKKMEELAPRFPQGVKYLIPFDTTKFVSSSIEEVITTFIEAILLVVLVVYLFLQNTRATIIPVIAVPVSLIGAFAGMYVLGFSINLLTLFGMVLAIGIVVDDAIVVLENVERIMRTEHLSPKDAALKAMEEVSGPIIAIVLVLCAVFVPVGFLGGLTGVMYKQFAITIAVSVVISGIVALTLTPALCAVMLKAEHHNPNAFFRKFNEGFESLTDRYSRGVGYFLRKPAIGFLFFAAIVSVALVIFMRIPGALVPEEDQGYVFIAYNLMPGSSLKRTQAVTGTVMDRLHKSVPEVANTITLNGFDILSTSQKSEAAITFTPLKPWSERKGDNSDSFHVVKRIMGLAADLKDGMVFAINPPPITGISITGGFEGYLQSRVGADPFAVSEAVNKIIAAAAKRPEITGVRTTLSTRAPQYFITLDREKAKALNVPVNAVFTTMQATFGTYYINDFTYSGRIFRVNMQSEADFREKPEDLRQVFVRSNDGNMVSLDSLLTITRTVGPDLMERFNGLPAAKITGNPAPGYSSGQALTAMEEVLGQTLSPTDWSLGWTGAAYQERSTGGTSGTAFIFGLIMVFLILAAQYERWTLPIAVLLTVPFAVFGAALAVMLRGLYNDVYFQVGLLTLIGLSAKNAILIVEFAVLEYQSGKTIAEAAMSAAKLRFRPIIMTSLAFVLGCMPLVISEGAGAASRHSIGTGIVGGMLAATAIATLFVPMFFWAVMTIGEKLKGKKAPAHTNDETHHDV